MRGCYSRVRSLRPVLDSFVSPVLIRREIELVAGDSRPILVGPWLSEVGFEVLYWIPFLNWIRAEFGLNKDHVTVISRGGVAHWYGNICENYIDIFDYFTPEEFKVKNEQRVASFKVQKQVAISDFDREILHLAKRDLNSDETRLLHPSLMYRLFRLFWSGRRSIHLVQPYSRYQELPPVDMAGSIEGLPTDYIAVKFYFSACFPDTEQNRAFVSNLLTDLTSVTNVVLLDTGLDIDDHFDYSTDTAERIYNVRHLMNPRNNLDVQTRIISRACAFVGTYGGFSYLAPFYGVDSLSFYSHENFLPVHLDVARRAFSTLKRGSFVVLNVKDLDLVRLLFK